MESPERDGERRTRRDVLGGLAGVAAAGTAGAGAAAADSPDGPAPTVLTQNLYVGLEFTRLLGARSPAEFRRVVGDYVDDVDPAVYRARAEAVARAIDGADADVVALQEAAALRRQSPGDVADPGAEAAEGTLVDLLAETERALADRGLDYRAAAVSTESDVELPGRTDDGRVDLRVTDRDALLVRDGVDVADAGTETFDTDVSLEVPGTDRTVSLCRGYARADLSTGGEPFTAVSTHLESVSSFVRELQAAELRSALPDGRPVIVGGDLNSGPGGPTAAYRRLLETFSDAFETMYPDAAGHTCCRSADLRNARSRLGRRIDAVLYRGALVPTDAGRVNHRRGDRVAVDDGSEPGAAGGSGGTDRVWPSDHAGVVASFAPFGG